MVTTKNWYKTTIARIPTNFSTPFTVAIEAVDPDHAVTRLRNLYSPHVYASYGGANPSLGEYMKLVTEDDEIRNARRHYLDHQ